MANMNKTLDKLVELLDEIEEELFKDGDIEVVFHGEVYTKASWRNYKAVVKNLQKRNKDNIKTSHTYLEKNRKYNSIMVRISQYRNKENKTEEDYKRIEELMKEREQYIIDKNRKNVEKAKKQLNKVIEQYENKERGV